MPVTPLVGLDYAIHVVTVCVQRPWRSPARERLVASRMSDHTTVDYQFYQQSIIHSVKCKLNGQMCVEWIVCAKGELLCTRTSWYCRHRAGLPDVYSVHVHSRPPPHHRGCPTTMANMKKIVIHVFLETDNPHCGYCFKSFSLCILVQFGTARKVREW